jgi:dolichol-phosphate mannosyltransferase
MNTLVIIPTYNERENIAELIEKILQLAENFHVLVIDDNSPDGTAQVVEGLGHADRVHLLIRPKKLGLGTAYSAGFEHALEKGYGKAATMDADFSHDPSDIPRLAEASGSADLVIGSRYIKGGRTVNWGIFRKILSRVANFLAHDFLSLKPADCTSGFRLYQTDLLRRLEFQSIRADGYSYLVEILMMASWQKARVAEVPIVFVERRRGKSKISRGEIFKAIRTMLRLRTTKPQS